MITKIATIFIKQANPYEDYDDVTVFTDNPTAQAAALTGIGVTGGAVGGGVYGLRKLRKAKGAVADLLTGDAATLAGDAKALNSSKNALISDADAITGNKKAINSVIGDLRGNGAQIKSLGKKIQHLDKRHNMLINDLIPNSSKAERDKLVAELQDIIKQQKLHTSKQNVNMAKRKILLSRIRKERGATKALQALQNEHLEQQVAQRALQDEHLVQRAEHMAQKDLLNTTKSKLKYIGKPAAIGAGLLGTGTLAYGLYNKLKHS